MKRKTYLIGIFLSVGLFAFVGVVGAATWTPLVQIPGIPLTGINLSTYLVGLYNFMLSVVGIVAVMMLIVAGMRYITAAGNATSITDAKSIAGNAIVGLLLALLSFVILKTINPDVLYLKKPGAGFLATPSVDQTSCGSYNVTGPVCTCRNGETPAAANIILCDAACDTPARCTPAPKNICLDPNFKRDATAKECHCLNGLKYPRGAFPTCQAMCSDPANNDNSVDQNFPYCIRNDLKGVVERTGEDITFFDHKTINLANAEAVGVKNFDEITLQNTLTDPLNLLSYPIVITFTYFRCVDNNLNNTLVLTQEAITLANYQKDVFSSQVVNHPNHTSPADPDWDCWPWTVIDDSVGLTVFSGFIRVEIEKSSPFEFCMENDDCQSGTCTGICAW